jgi:cytochrome P450
VGSAQLEDEVRLMEASWFMSQPYETYERLRNEAPVYWSARDRVWAVSKYNDIRFVSRNAELFASGYHIYVAYADPPDDGQLSEDGSSMPRSAQLRRRAVLNAQESLVMADGERHAFLRKLASYAFTPKAIRALENQVQQIASDLFDEIPDEVPVDFVDMVAAPLPMIMIALMLGVPREHLDRFRLWSDTLIDFADEAVRDGPGLEHRIALATEFREYFAAELHNRSINPRDDLLTQLAVAKWKGKSLAIEEQLSMVFVLLIAGNETTRSLIAGAGQLMAEQPDQRSILIQSPDLIPNAVEEFLRYISPVTHMCRTALEDTELRGQQIQKGDFVCLLYGAGNRDHDIWSRAESFDVTRRPDPAHVAFGFGEHFCLGNNLARREIKIVLAELLRRFPNYEVVGPYARTVQHMTPGIKSLPVIFHR